ncbi:MAG: cytochrome P450, partial [Verrucomicrobiales bacterium]
MPESAPLSSSLRFNPLSEEFQENPYPYYQRLREEDPVHRSWSFQPEWILTRYDDVRRVLLDREVFAVEKLDQKLRAKNRLLAAEGKDLNSLVNVTSGWLLFIDPPNHTRLRSLVIRAFTPRVVEDIAPQIQDIVTGLIDAFAGDQEVDVVRGLASP